MVFAFSPRPNLVPHVSGVIERPRLSERMQAAYDHKLTLICAPPGYGKTTLAAQFAEQTPYKLAWQTLEERDRDLPNLFAGALAALEGVAPGIQDCAPLPGCTPGELATLLADELNARTTEPIFYVLDDIHVLAGSPAAEAWLQVLVGRLSLNVHLIIVGRILPNLPLTELIARGDVLALGQEQLRFTAEEIYDLARQSRGSITTRTEAEALAERLEGWPAGTVLALHPLPVDLEQVMLRGGTGPEALFNALAASMLDAQPPALADFLVASSTLTRLTPELCGAVLGLGNAAYWLREAQNRSLFLSRMPGGLVYHRLFRDFLQLRLQTENPRLFVRLHMRAARWFGERQQVELAFEHYFAGGMVARAAALAEESADLYFSQGKVETLLKWRSRLGPACAFAPRLLYNCARVYTDRYHYDDAENALNEAVRAFETANGASGLIDVQLQRAFIQLQRGQFQQAVQAASALTSPEVAPNQRGRALKIVGVAHLRLGEVASAVEELEQSRALHRADGDSHALANTLQDLSVAYSRLGHFREASACLQDVVALRRELGSAGALASALNNLGYYYHRGGHYQRALATFEEGLSAVARSPNRRVESALLWSLGDLKRDLGIFDEGLRLHNRALELIGASDPWLRCAVLVSCSTLRRWQGDAAEAAALASKALELAEAHGVAVERATAVAALWSARAALGADDDVARSAGQYLGGVLEMLNTLGARGEHVWVLGQVAGLALAQEDLREADRVLRVAMREADEVGGLHMLAAEVCFTPALAQYVHTHANAFPQLIEALQQLRSAQLEAQPSGKTAQIVTMHETFSLRVYTLGRERLERDGEPVPENAWRSATARELFYYLLFHGSESRERLSVIFWPESSAKRVRSNFHTTLYRARQALGENVILFDEGIYRLNPDLDLWCDAHEMDELVRQARLMPPRDARTEDLWRRAVALYRGNFLPSWDNEWALYRRERLFEQYIEALVGLGQCARARQDHRAALDAFRRALDSDPYREDIHRAVMQCYADLGEKKQVHDHLERLRTLLWDELALEPSVETTTLAESLLA